jgi:hypothetical protein
MAIDMAILCRHAKQRMAYSHRASCRNRHARTAHPPPPDLGDIFDFIWTPPARITKPVTAAGMLAHQRTCRYSRVHVRQVHSDGVLA